jgi:hypothetical protein
MRLRIVLFVGLVICLATPPAGAAVEGDLIANVDLPVQGQGVSVAVDCEGVIYYTHTDGTLYMMDSAGNDLGSVPITDSGTGAPVAIDEMAWDESRQILWGQEHESNPVDVYEINAVTGVATFSFTATQTVSVGTYRDGIAFDGADDSLWLTGDVSTTVEHYAASTGAYLGDITPKNEFGGDLGLISGITVGVGDLLYLGRNGAVEIVQVRKSDGGFIASFASPGGARDEGLECDPVNFDPVLALWSREFYQTPDPAFVSAIQIEPGTCECGGGAVITCTLGFWKNHIEEWVTLTPEAVPPWGGGSTYLEIFYTAPKKGDASVILAHAFIAATLNTGADATDLADALAMLLDHPIGSGDLQAGRNAHPDRAVALSIAENLQTFNESAECTLGGNGD